MRTREGCSTRRFTECSAPSWTTSVARLLIILLGLQTLWVDPSLAAQAPGRQPLGSLATTGEVYVNESRVSGEVTIFVGDLLRTGADGAASVTISGRGMLIVAKQTEISFAPSPRYFAELRHGAVGFRTLAGTTNFELRICCNFIVVPAPDTEAAADIECAPDRGTKVSSTKGSMGVISLEGPESIFLHPGEVATISPDCRMSTTAPQAGAPQPAGPPSGTPAPTPHPGHTKLIVLGLVGGGAAGAAVGLAKALASPSTP